MMRALQAHVQGDGPYDQLYRASPRLWSDAPGRMVERAARLLSAGRALDLGCGDGRNALWLEQRGWAVDGVDVSRAAVAGAARRFAAAGHKGRGCLRVADAATAHFESSQYDLVLVYGLYHCLSDERLRQVHANATRALRSGGLLAFSALDDRQPVPPGHTTGRLWLRSAAELRRLVGELELLTWEEGEIHEEHAPMVGAHRHAVVWALAAA